MQTFNVDVTIRGTGNDATSAVMNYSHNDNAIRTASSVTMALSDYTEESVAPEGFRTELVSIDVTVHDASTCRYCNKAGA